MVKKPLPAPSDEDLAWAAGQLERFKHLRGYPDPETHGAAFQSNCEALLRIVWRKPVAEIIGEAHPDLPGDGNPIDAEWLIEEALDRLDHFPLPIELREIYQEYLPPRDGKEWFRSQSRPA